MQTWVHRNVERVADAYELMDGPVARADLERNLRDIAFANTWFGGLTPVLRYLKSLGTVDVLHARVAPF